MITQNSVKQVRDELAHHLYAGRFTSVNREASMTALVGNRTIELVGASFTASEPTIFGALDMGYLKREEAWYDSMSRNVNDIPGGAPAVWKAVASKDGTINSNYGFCVYSPENGGQFDKVIAELRKSPESRRAVIIYTRPSMWEEYNLDGRSDFMCTNAVQYLIRKGVVHACIQMRSNDAVFGFKNDRFWQQTVLERLAAQLGLPSGDLFWNAGSLHVYERHFYLVDHYQKTGELSIAKAKYRELYPESPYSQNKET
jgi:Straboviridae dCMP hydroxymethylase